MLGIDAGVLLKNGAGVPRLEDDFCTADTCPGAITNEPRPARSTRRDQRPVELGDELGIDDHVTDVEVLPRGGLHDVVNRRGVDAEMLEVDPLHYFQLVPEMSRAFRASPAVDHRPVDVGQHELAGAVHSGDAGTDPAREGVARWHGVEGRPCEQGLALVHGLVADRGQEPRPDAPAPTVAPHEQVALHDSTIAGGVRPAKTGGEGRAVNGLDQPRVVVELRRQLPSERDVGLDRLRNAIRSTLRLDRCLDRVQSRQLFIRTGTEADATHKEVGRRGHRPSLPAQVPRTATVRFVRDGEWVRFVIHFEVLDLVRFREMATAMVAVSLDEPGTVVYDWYLDEPANKGMLYEAYVSPEALRAHGSGAVFTELAPRYLDALRVISVHAFGEAADLPRRDVLGAPTTWWGAPIAAVTSAG
jgi:quinol monooxygenase YgiN